MGRCRSRDLLSKRLHNGRGSDEFRMPLDLNAEVDIFFFQLTLVQSIADQDGDFFKIQRFSR